MGAQVRSVSEGTVAVGAGEGLLAWGETPEGLGGPGQDLISSMNQLWESSIARSALGKGLWTSCCAPLNTTVLSL